MLNHITIMGRITRDIELRRTGGGIAVASLCFLRHKMAHNHLCHHAAADIAMTNK